MDRRPRKRTQNVVDRGILVRSWGLLGGVSAVLVMTLFFATLLEGGWYLGADVGAGILHHTWQSATTMSFLGIVACQIGTAFASRTEHASLAKVGVASNPLLLWGIAFEVCFAALVVTVPVLRHIFGTVIPQWHQVLWLLPLPFIVWGCDEAWRWHRRRTPGSVAPRSPAEVPQ